MNSSVFIIPICSAVVIAAILWLVWLRSHDETLGRPLSGHQRQQRDENHHPNHNGYEEGPDHTLATQDAGESSVYRGS